MYASADVRRFSNPDFTILVPGFWTVVMPYGLVPRARQPDVRGVGAVCRKVTPLPLDPPKKLVTDGPHGAGMLLGEAAVFPSWALAEWAVGLFVCANGFLLLVEEPTLKRKFGAE